MQVTLTPGQEALIRQELATGRFTSVEEALADALMLWQQREVERAAFLETLDQAEASAEPDAIPITETNMRALADDIKRRGRERRRGPSTSAS